MYFDALYDPTHSAGLSSRLKTSHTLTKDPTELAGSVGCWPSDWRCCCAVRSCVCVSLLWRERAAAPNGSIALCASVALLDNPANFCLHKVDWNSFLEVCDHFDGFVSTRRCQSSKFSPVTGSVLCACLTRTKVRLLVAVCIKQSLSWRCPCPTCSSLVRGRSLVACTSNRAGRPCMACMAMIHAWVSLDRPHGSGQSETQLL
jgi:hypothetical protein